MSLKFHCQISQYQERNLRLLNFYRNIIFIVPLSKADRMSSLGKSVAISEQLKSKRQLITAGMFYSNVEMLNLNIAKKKKAVKMGKIDYHFYTESQVPEKFIPIGDKEMSFLKRIFPGICQYFD